MSLTHAEQIKLTEDLTTHVGQMITKGFDVTIIVSEKKMNKAVVTTSTTIENRWHMRDILECALRATR